MKTLLKYKILNNKKETEKKVYVYNYEIENNLKNTKGEIKNDKKYKKEQKKK